MVAISIILPVRDGERFLAEAINSALSQTVRDFELLVVLDQTTDDSEEIARSLQRDDPRIRLLNNRGSGLADALNTGADAASGDLIARLDADDRMQPRRLELQQGFLRRHPETVAIGSSAVVIDAASRTVGRIRVPQSDAKLRSRLVRGNPFVHSSMSLRRSAFMSAGRYRNDFPFVEDFDLWLRLARIGKLANFVEPLVDYRRHAAAVSARFPTTQRLNLQLCLLDWKWRNTVIETPEYQQQRGDLITLFARAAELAQDPDRLEQSDLQLFDRMLPHLDRGESRFLAQLVTAASRAGRVTPAIAAGFRIRSTITSRIVFSHNCRMAARRLSIGPATPGF